MQEEWTQMYWMQIELLMKITMTTMMIIMMIIAVIVFATVTIIKKIVFVITEIGATIEDVEDNSKPEFIK